MKQSRWPGKGPLPDPPAPVRAALEQALAPFPARPPRHAALPMLQAAQAAAGWLSPEVLAWLSRRSRIPVADLTGLASFYELLSTARQGQHVIRVCDDVACSLDGRAAALLGALRQELGIGPGETTPDGRFTLYTSACLGGCDRGPCMLVDGQFAGPVAPDGAAAMVRPAVPAADGGAAPPAPAGAPADLSPAVPPAAPPSFGWLPGREPLLLARCGSPEAAVPAPPVPAAYAAAGGWEGLRRALELSPDEVTQAVQAAGLVGRGGAAFPAGAKWAAAARAPGSPKYIVLNGDESEPATYTNRLLMERDPLALVEGMLIAAYATGASRGCAYIRGEYDLAFRQFAAAVDAARQAGLLGRSILGRAGFDFDIEVRRGAGAYVCGEETALFASIEGYRGEPRVRPPYPTAHGLFGRPTVIHNVETLACVPLILRRGPVAFAAGQPKLFAVSGHVGRPGVYEAPLGTPLARLLDQCGGVAGELQAVLVGGATGMFLRPDQLETPLDFAALRDAGATMGTGAVLVLNRTVDLWQVAGRIARFFAHESCGKCIPCRVGTARQWELVRLVADRGSGTGDAVALLQDLGAAMADASICGLGQAASWPILSLIRQFGGPGEVRADGHPDR